MSCDISLAIGLSTYSSFMLSTMRSMRSWVLCMYSLVAVSMSIVSWSAIASSSIAMSFLLCSFRFPISANTAPDSCFISSSDFSTFTSGGSGRLFIFSFIFLLYTTHTLQWKSCTQPPTKNTMIYYKTDIIFLKRSISLCKPGN